MMKPVENKKVGVLLLNLGTPDAPNPKEVGRYLREFLSDPYVIDIHAIPRWILVNLVITPFRKHKAAEAYRKVWTDRGSPLKIHLEDLHRELSDQLGGDFAVEQAMRYQNPTLRKALESLRKSGVTEIRLISLYPQYSLATNLSTEEKVEDELRDMGWKVKVRVLPPFYRDAGFIESFRERIQNVLDLGPFDRLILSYHGLPERHVLKADCSGVHCLKAKDCCDVISEKNESTCYRAHCYETTRQLTRALKLPMDTVLTSFQSRLDKKGWLDPDTVKVVEDLTKNGVKRIVVACPAFTADCLETLEEVGIRLRAQFLAMGGEDFRWVPSLNAEPTWVRTVARYAREESRYV